MKPLRIAVCDGEQAERELLEKYIRDWATFRKYQAIVFFFFRCRIPVAGFFPEGL